MNRVIEYIYSYWYSISSYWLKDEECQESDKTNLLVTMHPKELTREAVEELLDDFKKKLKRKTTRNDLDRLILSVERMEFEDKEDYSNYIAEWTEVIFEKVEGKIEGKIQFKKPWDDEYGPGRFKKWTATELQRKILERNPQYKEQNRIEIKRSKLQGENGHWNRDLFRKGEKISEGGEAIVFDESFKDLKVAVRVQCFDPALFTEALNDDELHFKINLSADYEIAESDESENAIPLHKNVVKHFSNIEIFLQVDEMEVDCLGCITIMEKCDGNLKDRLRDGTLSLQKRKELISEIKNGLSYLEAVGINHYDAKPENVLLMGDVPKWIDFGVVLVPSRRRSFEEMGYAPRGRKYRSLEYIHAGTPAFTTLYQLMNTGHTLKDIEFPIHVWLLCDWKTAWYLQFKPIETKDEREDIKQKLMKFNAGGLDKHYCVFTWKDVENVSGVISLEDASSSYELNDANLTKSTALSYCKQQFTRQMNADFKNLTQNVVDQKDTNLCVPISVTTLIRWALEHDLKSVPEEYMRRDFSMERIFTTIVMIIYPRSMTGLNLNPKEGDQKFQRNEVKTLLERLKFRTYLNKTGWEILTQTTGAKADYDFETVFLHDKMDKIDRPLTVTGAYLEICPETKEEKVFFHQMVVDRIDQNKYFIQNTLIKHSGTEISIPINRPYYVRKKFIEECYSYYDRYVWIDDKNNKRELVHENHNNMQKGIWYLCPQAYSITLTRKEGILPSW